MSEQWRLGCTYADGLTHLTEIREDGPHGASRLVCTAPPEDARRIVEAVNGSDDRKVLAAEVERLMGALEFYADIREYNTVAGDPPGSDPPIIVGDRGARARAALAASAERPSDDDVADDDCAGCRMADEDGSEGFYDWGPGGGPPDHTCRERPSDVEILPGMRAHQARMAERRGEGEA